MGPNMDGNRWNCLTEAFLGTGSSRSHVQALSHSCFSFPLGCLPHGESAARLASVSAGRLGAIDFEPP